jgi:hypothetical protein
MTMLLRMLRRLSRRDSRKTSGFATYRGAPNATRCLQEGARWARDHR